MVEREWGGARRLPWARWVRGEELLLSLRYRLLSVVAVALALAAWGVITNVWVRNSVAFPSPQQLARAFLDLWTRGYTGHVLLEHTEVSLVRAIVGFALAVALGMPVGLLVGYSRFASAVVSPFVGFIRPIPPISFVTLFVFYFGIGETSKIALIFLTGFWYMILTTSSGVRSVPEYLVRAGRNVGMSSAQLFWHVILPGTLPSIFVGMRTALALSWALVVAAELIAAHAGLGYIIQDATQFFRIDYVYVAILIIGLIGFVLDVVVASAGYRIIHWEGRT